MNIHKCFAMIFIAVGAFVSADSSVFAGDTYIERASLRGIKKVLVAVEPLGPEVENEVLNTEQIQSDVEQMLREAGIEVAKPYSKDVPYLYVKPTIIKETGGYIYNIGVEVCQAVSLKGSPAIQLTPACTWSVGSVGMTHDVNTIRHNIEVYAGEFVNAYFSVNPQMEKETYKRANAMN